MMENANVNTKNQLYEMLAAVKKMQALPQPVQEKLTQRFYGAVDYAKHEAEERVTKVSKQTA